MNGQRAATRERIWVTVVGKHQGHAVYAKKEWAHGPVWMWLVCDDCKDDWYVLPPKDEDTDVCGCVRCPKHR